MPGRPVAVVHPGTQHSWQTAMALDRLGRLEFYATSIFYQPDRLPYRLARLLPAALRRRAEREFRRFECPGLDPTKVRTAGLYEWAERIAARTGRRTLARRLDARGNRSFADALAREMRGPRPFAVWGYNGSSRQLFEQARAAGRPCILDRTIGDWRSYNALMDEQYNAYPDFFPSASYRIAQEKIDGDDAEYALADVILAGSPYCADTIRAHVAPAVAERVRVLNYCFDEQLFAGLPPLQPRRTGPVRFLFLGQANVRKGFHVVLEVFKQIPASAATLTVVGDLQLPPATWARYADRVDYRRTVPRSEVPALMAQADVFLLPSLFEGAGIVLYEALAAGAALIQSRAAAIAVTSETGILLDRVDEDALYEAVMTAVEDRDRLAAWRAAAQGAADAYRFDSYRDGIAQVLEELAW